MAQCPNCKLSSTVRYLYSNYYDLFDDHNNSMKNYSINYYCTNCELDFHYTKKTYIETEQEKLRRERKLKLKKLENEKN